MRLHNKYKGLSIDELKNFFINSCTSGCLRSIKDLSELSEFKEQISNPLVIDFGFRLACEQGHLEIVKYLLVSPNLKKHADIRADNSVGFRMACAFGYLDIIKYLLTSSELKEHVNIHEKNDLGFKWACSYGHLEVVKYLIFDYGIEKTEEIADFLENKKKDNVNNWFRVRDLNNMLEEKLLDNKDAVNDKKVKL